MKYEMTDGTLKLFLEGHIDSSNAEAVEAEITAAREKESFSSVLVDAENLEYISSAGLRVLLRLRKACPQMEVINVRPEVYEVFDITGFTESKPYVSWNGTGALRAVRSTVTSITLPISTAGSVTTIIFDAG